MNDKNGKKKGYAGDVIFLIILGVYIVFFRKNVIIAPVNEKLDVYFSVDRIGALIDFFSITIGIYITMISILAISITKIMEALLKERKEEQILNVMMWGLISNVIAVLLLVFMPVIQGGNIILLAILLWAVLHMIYFFFVLFTIFEYNIQNMDKEIDNENEWRNGIKKKIDIIQSDVQKITKDIKK